MDIVTMVWNLLTMLDILYKRICKPTGAYRGIEKEGGGRDLKCCDNHNEASRAESAQGWGSRGRDVPFPWVRKF